MTERTAGAGAVATGTDHDERTGTPGRLRSGAGGAPIAAAISVFGELLITAGLVLGLFVVYSLWWTNVMADREAAAQGDSVRRDWAGECRARRARHQGRHRLPARAGDEERRGAGQEGHRHRRPQRRCGRLLHGPGQGGAAGPAKTGNFTLAAHRDGHGAKFHNIDKLKNGDPVVFETKDTWYVYKVFAELTETSKYNVDVLQPVPEGVGRQEARPLHHADDLHPGLHVEVPLHRVGRAGAHREGRRQAHPAGRTALARHGAFASR